MPEHRSSTTDDRVVSIRTRRRYDVAGNTDATQSPDLSDYERSAESDDFRHRMVVNAVAFLFVAALVLAGLWIADTMITMRKTHDCFLTGKRGCAPVEVPTAPR